MTHPTPALVDIEELERQLSDILTAHAHYQDVFFGPTIAAASHNSLALLAELRALRVELAELRSQANEYGRHPFPASAELERALKTVQFFVDCAIVRGTNPSGAPQALSRIAAALGLGSGQ